MRSARGGARWARRALWLVLYGAAVVWLTWPLAAHVGSHLPNVKGACRFDTPLNTWALAHQTLALTSDPGRLPHGNIFYPTRLALYYGEAGFGALPFFAPLFLLTGNPTFAENAYFLLAVVLTAWGLHLVVARRTGSALAGVTAGATLLSSRWLLWEWVPCCPNYSVLVYFPPILWLSSLRDFERKHLVALALLVAAQSLVSIYLAAAVLVPLGLLALCRITVRRSRREGLALLLATLAGALLAAPAYLGYLAVRFQDPSIQTQTFWRGAGAPLRLPWGLLGYLSPMAVPLSALLIILLGGAAFALAGRKHAAPALRDLWRTAIFWTLVGLALSIPPQVSWNGRPIAMPQTYLDQVSSLYSIVRVPIRLGVAGLMGLCVLAGLAFAALTRGLRERCDALGRAAPVALAVVLLAAMLEERRSGFNPFGARGVRPEPAAYPLMEAPRLDPELRDALRDGAGPLLELPIGPNGVPVPEPQTRAMYRSIHHRRPILNGYNGYWPAGFPERMQLAHRLPDPDALDALVRETGLTTIVVDLDALDPEARRAWLDLAAAAMDQRLRLTLQRPTYLVFEVSK